MKQSATSAKFLLTKDQEWGNVGEVIQSRIMAHAGGFCEPIKLIISKN